MPVRIVCRLESIRFRFYRRENPLGILADIFVSLAGDDEDFAGLFFLAADSNFVYLHFNNIF